MLMSVVNELVQQTNNMSSCWQQDVGGQAEAERWNSVGKMAALHRRGGWRGCRATCPTLNKGLHSTEDAGPRATRWNRCSRTRDYCRALEWFLQKRVIDVTAAMTGSRATFATTEARGFWVIVFLVGVFLFRFYVC